MFAKRIEWPRLVRRITPVVLLLGMASAGAAQRPPMRPHIGPHVGFNFDSEDFLIGAQFTLPLVGRLEFYPSFDVYFPDQGTLLGFNGDLKVSAPLAGELEVYGGGGLNVLYLNVNDNSETDLGANLIGGVETRLVGRVHPYFEGRLLLRDESSFQVIVGLNVTLYTNR